MVLRKRLRRFLSGPPHDFRYPEIEMTRIDQVREAINRYTLGIPLPQPREYLLALADVQDSARAGSHRWSERPGICVFFTAGGFHYIGRALKAAGLVERVYAQAQPWTQEWNAVLADPTFAVAVYEFRDQDQDWLPSLELFLVQQFLLRLRYPPG